jgi:acyl carrier protein
VWTVLSVSELENRLLRCFSSVFPGFTEEELRAASARSVGFWDSLSGVTLAAVIEEEFGVEIDPEVISQLDSFEAFRIFLRQSKPRER